MPSTPTDVHLSEVHLHIAGSTSGAEEVSSFAYSTADSQRGEEEQDEDGDQVVKRRRMVGRSGVLKLKHALATPLPDVGLQVWRGALLLCDYLLARPALVRDATVLELGSGCGLSGLLAAATARRVFLTDCVESVLVNAQENVWHRPALVQHRRPHARVCLPRRQVELNGVEAVTRVRALDWAEPVLPLSGAADEPAPAESSSAAAAGPFAWSDAERAELRECSLILAADCVRPRPRIHASWAAAAAERAPSARGRCTRTT